MDYKKLIIYICGGALISLLLFSLLLYFFHNESFKTNIQKSYLKQNLEDKNLKLIEDMCYSEKCSDLNLNEFKLYIQEVYKYNFNYDCKYWALIWSLYLDKHNLKYKYITTDTHIFIVTYNKSSYTIIDQNKIYTQKLN